VEHYTLPEYKILIPRNANLFNLIISNVNLQKFKSGFLFVISGFGIYRFGIADRLTGIRPRMQFLKKQFMSRIELFR